MENKKRVPTGFSPESSPESTPDLRDMDVQSAILEGNDPVAQDNLQKFLGFTKEQFDLAAYYTKLRRSTIDECERQGEIRRKTSPEETAEEKELGIYSEYIEPQVRNAIIQMRDKGYSTWESGFAGFNEQRISFGPDDLPPDFELPVTTNDFLNKQGVESLVESGAITLDLHKPLTLDEIKIIWDKIAEDLPALGHPPKSIEEIHKIIQPQSDRELLASIEEKQENLERIRERVNEVKDALGEPVDEGIKEAVVMFNAFGLRTTQSCEGHPEEAKPGEKGPSVAPWVEVYPETPTDKEEWWNNDEIRGAVEKEGQELRFKAMSLLGRFYEDRKMPYDVMLVTEPIAYGFRVQSNGLETIEELGEAERLEKAKLYKKEMDNFTEFLREKYFLE